MVSKGTMRDEIMSLLGVPDNDMLGWVGVAHDFEKAKKHLLEMIDEGADIIDIGAESTKPYSKAVDAEEQLKKLLPVIDVAK